MTSTGGIWEKGENIPVAEVKNKNKIYKNKNKNKNKNKPDNNNKDKNKNKHNNKFILKTQVGISGAQRP